MSVPAKKKTKSSTRKGRSHLALNKKGLTKCSKCKKAILPHHACSFCGTYKNRETLKIKQPKNKKS